MQKTQIPSLGKEDPLEKEMATLAWKIPWTEAPGRLHSIRSQRVEQDWTNDTLGLEKLNMMVTKLI